MTTPEDDKLIERLADAFLRATAHRPLERDDIAARMTARGFLAMQRELEWARVMSCEHEWKQMPVVSHTMPEKHGKVIWACVRCGERLDKDTDQ